MEVRIFSDAYPPSISAGSTRNQYLVLSLLRRGVIVHVISNVKGARSIFGEKVTVVHSFHARTTNLAFRLLRDGLFILNACAYIRRDRSVLSLISVPSALLGLFLPIIHRLVGAQYALDIRDLYPDALFDKSSIFASRLFAPILYHLYYFGFRHATLISTVTEGMRSRMRTLGIDAQLFLNGFESNFRVSRSRVRRGGPLEVVCHGNFGLFQENRLLIQLAALGSSAGIRFKIIGFGRDFGRMKNLLSDCPNVVVLGAMAKLDVVSHLSQSDVGLSLRDTTSLSAYSFPVRVWDYIGAGLPIVIAPEETDASRFVSRMDLGIVCSSTVEAVSSALMHLRDNRHLLELYRSRVLSLGRCYSRESITEQLTKQLVRKLETF